MELAALVNAAWRPPGVEPRAGGERFAVGLRTLLPLLEAAGAAPDLVRALRLRPANEMATLVLPAGSGQARVELGNRQVAIPAALREAIRTALEQAAAPPGSRRLPLPATGPAVPSGTLDAVAAALRGDASAQAVARAVLGSTEPARASRETGRASREAARASRDEGRASFDTAHASRAGDRPAHAAVLAPLLDAADDAAAAATRLRLAVERSGLFFESHLASWLRSAEEGGAERMPADLRQPPLPSPERTAAQLDVLAHDAVRLQVCAWAGQPAQVELQRDSEAATGCDRPEVFGARLAVELPRLGPLDVRLRLSGSAVALTVACGRPQALESELPELAAQMRSRRLQPVSLQAVPLP
jgi:hypothetical protein